ncbi:uncharacterized protein LOC115420401 [Sphaeramia orbicularis]|uniref:uncharacterized protein LOC115420401 n=1 Tax=Sphaeramia orbicularis TaxID=375764 RepID=UPI00117D75DF|nr:uncharacterized protein LOC115420401 [Sphaeramia orbicularis]
MSVVPPVLSCTQTEQKWYKPQTMGVKPGPVDAVVVVKPKPGATTASGVRSALYKAFSDKLPDPFTLNPGPAYAGMKVESLPLICKMNISADKPLVDSIFGKVQAGSVLSYNSGRQHGSGIEELLEVFLPPSDDIPSHVGLPVPISCLRSPMSQQGSIRLLLQLDGIPYFQGPPPGSGIAAMTDPAATALSSRFDNGGGEHGPLRLNVPNLPRDLGEALPEVRVNDRAGIGLCQTFPAGPHNMFGPAESVQLPPLPADPIHHQVVIG